MLWHYNYTMSCALLKNIRVRAGNGVLRHSEVRMYLPRALSALALLTRRCVLTFFFFSLLFFSASGDDLLLFLPDSRSESDLPLQLAPNTRFAPLPTPARSESHDFSLRLIDSRSESDASLTSGFRSLLSLSSSCCCCLASSVLKSPGCDVSESPSNDVSSSLL